MIMVNINVTLIFKQHFWKSAAKPHFWEKCIKTFLQMLLPSFVRFGSTFPKGCLLPSFVRFGSTFGKGC